MDLDGGTKGVAGDGEGDLGSRRGRPVGGRVSLLGLFRFSRTAETGGSEG